MTGPGGDLATGTYLLEGAVILGSTVFCSRGGTYVPYDYRGGLRVTATSATAATFEFLEQHKQTNVATRLPTTVRYDVAVAAKAGTDLSLVVASILVRSTRASDICEAMARLRMSS